MSILTIYWYFILLMNEYHITKSETGLWRSVEYTNCPREHIFTHSPLFIDNYIMFNNILYLYIFDCIVIYSASKLASSFLDPT